MKIITLLQQIGGMFVHFRESATKGEKNKICIGFSNKK